MDDGVHNMLPRVPIPLQEATSRLVSKDPAARPTAQLLQLIKYFSDPAVHALQFLDVINMKDVAQKNNFYRSTLKDILLYIPRVSWNCLNNRGQFIIESFVNLDRNCGGSTFGRPYKPIYGRRTRWRPCYSRLCYWYKSRPSRNTKRSFCQYFEDFSVLPKRFKPP